MSTCVKELVKELGLTIWKELDEFAKRMGKKRAEEMEAAIKERRRKMIDSEQGAICGSTVDVDEFPRVGVIASGLSEFWKRISDAELHALATFLVEKAISSAIGKCLPNLHLLMGEIKRCPSTKEVLSFLRELKDKSTLGMVAI